MKYLLTVEEHTHTANKAAEQQEEMEHLQIAIRMVAKYCRMSSSQHPLSILRDRMEFIRAKLRK